MLLGSCSASGFLGVEGGRLRGIKHIPLANLVVVISFHQINVHMRIAIGISAVAEHGGKPRTRAVA